MFKRASIAGALLAAACAGEPTEPGADLARGGRPTSAIAGVALLDHRSLRCDDSSAEAVTAGTVTTITGSCRRNGVTLPFVWTSGSGAAVLDGQPGGMGGTAASDDGTTFGSAGPGAYYRPPNGAVMELPLPAGMVWGNVLDATPSGTLAIGSVSDEAGMSFQALGWRWSGETWTTEELPGGAAVSGDGNVLVGVSANRASVWTRSGASWVHLTLPDGGAIRSRATGINRAGTMISGVRTVQSSNDPAEEYEEPVVWVASGSVGWALEPLTGLFASAEGEALAVETLTDGRTAAVGWLWEDLAGGTEQLWAVAWIRPGGTGAFAAPLKLAPLAKGRYAWAHDVNPRGEVVGSSLAKGLSGAAILWQLP